MAHTTEVFGWRVDLLAILFIATRVLYLLFYWRDLVWQLSVVWAVRSAACY